MSFTAGVFPSPRKIAKLAPFHKKYSKLDFSNYCPISILSNLDKIVEKLMYTRVFKIFNENNFFYPLQYDFRQKYSTHALFSLTENIRKHLDEGNFAFGIFVWDILLTKLEHYGVRGLANDCFKSHLSDRK